LIRWPGAVLDLGAAWRGPLVIPSGKVEPWLRSSSTQAPWYATRSVQGVVKEDRGPIGMRGKRLDLVEFKNEPDYTSQVELPGELLESVPGSGSVR
jgi:hypothetical protein